MYSTWSVIFTPRVDIVALKCVEQSQSRLIDGANSNSIETSWRGLGGPCLRSGSASSIISVFPKLCTHASVSSRLPSVSRIVWHWPCRLALRMHRKRRDKSCANFSTAPERKGYGPSTGWVILPTGPHWLLVSWYQLPIHVLFMSKISADQTDLADVVLSTVLSHALQSDKRPSSPAPVRAF